MGGLAASHAALLADFAGAAGVAAELVLPPIPLDGCYGFDLVDEWVAVGLPLVEARTLQKALISDFNCAAQSFDYARKALDAALLHGTIDLNVLLSSTQAVESADISQASSGGQRQCVLTFVPSPEAVVKLLLPVRRLDELDPMDPRYRNPPRPLYDMVLEADVAETILAEPHADAPLFTAALLVNEEHLLRLRELYMGAATSSSADCAARDDERKDALWLRRLFCLLARYETVFGAARGLQGALPTRVFTALETHLGVMGECFASPLNCRYPRAYFSAYPDTDSAFSSMGDFFAASFLVEGAWEVNPPFTNAVLAAAVARLCELLAAAQLSRRALLFFLVTPSWPLAPFAQRLEACRWVRASGLLLGGEHTFIDGMQHREDPRWHSWRALADSHFFVLATDAAYERLQPSGLVRASLAVIEAFQQEGGPAT